MTPIIGMDGARMRRPWSVALAAAIICAATGLCGGSAVIVGQQPELLVELDRTELYTGESVRYRVTLNHVDTPHPPDLSHWTDFDVQYLGEHSSNFSSMTIINGRVTRSERRGQIYEYLLTPRRSGELTVPAPEVEVNGERVRGRELRITVGEPEKQDLAIVELAVDREEVYPLQPFRVRVTVALKSLPEPFEDVSPLRVVRGDPPALQLPWITDDPPAAGVATRQPWRLWLKDLIADDGFTINGVRLSGSSLFSVFDERRAAFAPQPQLSQREDLQGHMHTYWEYKFEAEFTAENLGPIRFGPVTMEGTLAAEKTPSGRLSGKRVYVIAPPIEVLVKGPPEDGRPASYIGAIGVFDITSTLTPQQAKVGDPLTLTLRVRGPGALQQAQAPDLSGQAGLDQQFKIYSGSARVTDQQWEAAYSLRPLTDRIREFPELEVAYFDVEQERYVVRKLPAIPLQVAPSDALSDTDVRSETLPSPGSDPSVPGADGLHASVTDPKRLRLDDGKMGVAIATTLGAMACFLSALAWSGRSRGRVQRLRRRRRRLALPKARRWLRAAQEHAQHRNFQPAATLLRQAVTELAAVITGQDTAEWTPGDLRQQVQQATQDAELAAQGERLLAASDAARFGYDTESLLRALEQALAWCQATNQRLQHSS